MQKMACLNENSVPSTLLCGKPKTWETTWECRDHRGQNNDRGTWAAKTMLVMLKGRTGSPRAEMGGQELASRGRGPLFLNNLWQMVPKVIKVRGRMEENAVNFLFVSSSPYKSYDS